MATFRNKGGKTRITFANGRDPIVVPEGGTYRTNDPEEQTALRKSGNFSVDRYSSETRVERFSSKTEKEND